MENLPHHIIPGICHHPLNLQPLKLCIISQGTHMPYIEILETQEYRSRIQKYRSSLLIIVQESTTYVTNVELHVETGESKLMYV